MYTEIFKVAKNNNLFFLQIGNRVLPHIKASFGVFLVICIPGYMCLITICVKTIKHIHYEAVSQSKNLAS